MLTFIYKSIRRLRNLFATQLDHFRTVVRFAGNGVRYSSFRTSGVPYVMVARGGKMTIGKNFAMNNGAKGNPIGCFQPCTLWVDRGAEIVIGDNVGISQTALISHCRIEVQSNVKIGGVLAYIPQISTRLMLPSVSLTISRR